MLLKEREYHTCPTCDSRKALTGEVYGCDACKKVIDMNEPEKQYLGATVFEHGSGGTKDLHCCSWRCMVKALRKVKCDYFISLPFLHYDKDVGKGMRAKDFFALLK